MRSIFSRMIISTLCGLFGLALMPFIAVSDANAVVCARGVVRAGCAGAAGAVVVRRPPVAAATAACRTVLVNGVWVRRCV
ncbi:hypothetical protein SSBR45G_31610 [Bradyrhizobium sp. SSBR45G]|uniref:hypothetical protein n=1 Tax=unclassified Bradyrhizobium TaxID=2631580 RepID=UPI002342A9B8|nr:MULTISPECIES: hypothetical protein [unclassified Bradyrhizobium]GLH78252.1 hypothetical protein SSBR45G_31610 [Bradyrhizobium sp. SSBR45G]GLH85981.1 hypothetical protein SSBR45R_34410 [Bradyrhizobium sp. SSBR45R]